MGIVVLWDRELYRSLILNSGGGWVGQQELSIKLRRWSGGPMGIVYHGLGNYTGAYIKLRRWLGGPNRSLVLNYGDGRVGPWGLCIMG